MSKPTPKAVSPPAPSTKPITADELKFLTELHDLGLNLGNIDSISNDDLNEAHAACLDKASNAKKAVDAAFKELQTNFAKFERNEAVAKDNSQSNAERRKALTRVHDAKDAFKNSRREYDRTKGAFDDAQTKAQTCIDEAAAQANVTTLKQNLANVKNVYESMRRVFNLIQNIHPTKTSVHFTGMYQRTSLIQSHAVIQALSKTDLTLLLNVANTPPGTSRAYWMNALDTARNIPNMIEEFRTLEQSVHDYLKKIYKARKVNWEQRQALSKKLNQIRDRTKKENRENEYDDLVQPFADADKLWNNYVNEEQLATVIASVEAQGENSASNMLKLHKLVPVANDMLDDLVASVDEDLAADLATDDSDDDQEMELSVEKILQKYTFEIFEAADDQTVRDIAGRVERALLRSPKDFEANVDHVIRHFRLETKPANGPTMLASWLSSLGGFDFDPEEKNIDEDAYADVLGKLNDLAD